MEARTERAVSTKEKHIWASQDRRRHVLWTRSNTQASEINLIRLVQMRQSLALVSGLPTDALSLYIWIQDR